MLGPPADCFRPPNYRTSLSSSVDADRHHRTEAYGVSRRGFDQAPTSLFATIHQQRFFFIVKAMRKNFEKFYNEKIRRTKITLLSEYIVTHTHTHAHKYTNMAVISRDKYCFTSKDSICSDVSREAYRRRRFSHVSETPCEPRGT